MQAAKMKKRPDFPLMRQTDVQHIYHMQMPRWLFSDPRYAEMSLDAKVTYTFLLNRFQLSRRNGWTNDQGEVFVIFPRKELARELRICEQRVTAAFRKLVELKLIWEKRCGRGDANQIYLASIEPMDDPTYTSAPFLPEHSNEHGSRTANPEVLDNQESGVSSQEAQDTGFKANRICDLRTAVPQVLEPQRLGASYKEQRDTKLNHIEVSQSILQSSVDKWTDDEEELADILDACELYSFTPETARIFENAIERLFYSENFRVGNALLPQKRVRAKLRLLDVMILRETEQKLHSNLDKPIKNSTAYVMSTLFNCITETESDLMVDGYLNYLRQSDGG